MVKDSMKARESSLRLRWIDVEGVRGWKGMGALSLPEAGIEFMRIKLSIC